MLVRRTYLATEVAATMNPTSQLRLIKGGNLLVLQRRISLAVMRKVVGRNGEDLRKEEVKREERRRVRTVMTATMRSPRKRGSL